MLSRHFLRAKALQAIYSYQSAGSATTMEASRRFSYNINRLNELGAIQLGVLQYVIEAGRQSIEDGLHKHLPSYEDLHPSYRAVDNKFLTILFANFDYRKQTESYKFPWLENDDIWRKIYMGFKATPKYKDYLETEEATFEVEQRMALDLFKYVMNQESFRELIYERSLLWEDDFDQIAQYNYAMLKALNEEDFNEATMLPVMNDERDERDCEAYNFARQLVIDTINGIEPNNDLIKKHLKGWDFDRIAQMDILLLNMAITEFTTCASIPERVTVNEYIELSKEFSTDKSKIFINGILDKIIIELRSAGRINKDARGMYIPDLDDENE